MKEWMIQQGVIMYILAGCLVVGLVSAMIANHGYKRLIREADMMGNSDNRLLKYIKLKFSSYYKLNMRPQDSRALTRHYLHKYKIGFWSAATWRNIPVVMMSVSGLAFGAWLIFMMFQGRKVTDLVMTGVVWGMTEIVLLTQNHLYNYREKQAALEWHVMDYLENFLKNKIESGKSLQNYSVESVDKDLSKQNEESSVRPSHELNRSQNGTGRSPRVHSVKTDQEIAAAKFAFKSKPNRRKDLVGDEFSGEPEDEIDARIVEDILKEFLC